MAPGLRRQRPLGATWLSLQRNSLRVSHLPFVAEAQAGLALTYRGVRFTYTQVLRTPEFYERDRFEQFGSINVTFRY